MKSLIFLTEINNNNSIINALINGNGKYLQELDISYTNYFNRNELMRQICCHLTQLKKLKPRCESLVSLELLLISSRKNLQVLHISMNLNEFPIIISLESYEISKTLRKLKISSYCFNLLTNALKYMDNHFLTSKKLFSVI